MSSKNYKKASTKKEEKSARKTNNSKTKPCKSSLLSPMDKDSMLVLSQLIYL